MKLAVTSRVKYYKKYCCRNRQTQWWIGILSLCDLQALVIGAFIRFLSLQAVQLRLLVFPIQLFSSLPNIVNASLMAAARIFVNIFPYDLVPRIEFTSAELHLLERPSKDALPAELCSCSSLIQEMRCQLSSAALPKCIAHLALNVSN